jgi:ATP-dependent Clp protease adaptor protein ClpS
VAESKLLESVLTGSSTDDKTDTPRMWRVLIHNDDFTTQEFVVWILETVFSLPHADAVTIMMHVHQTGLGVAGLFTHDVAETKAKHTRQLAEQHEFPLLVTIEPAHEDAHQ